MTRPHRPRKRFGQHFLHDPGVIQAIVDAIGPARSDHLVEIGPGQGALTRHLLANAARIDAIELDRDLADELQRTLPPRSGLTVHQQDALDFDFCSLAPVLERDQDVQGRTLRVVGNLPYNISTPLIFHLLAQADCILDMHFLLQREVVQRMAAPPGGRTYGRLGIMVQYRCRVEPLFTVPASAFTPPPKVESAVVRLTPWEQPPVQVRHPEQLEEVVREAFNHRRKTLRNCLRPLLDTEQIEAAGVDPGARPETLDLEAFARLANAVTESRQTSPV